jgi:hypothetical protein
MVLRVTRYVAIRAPGLTILLSLLNYHMTTYCVTLGYTTHLNADFSAEFTTLNGVFEAAHSRSTSQLQHILHEIGSIDVDAVDRAAVEGSSTGGKTFDS